ncbi:MAG: MBL fold metallo-hydrolase [Candidatus Delongbacteria bacterium]|nr:MBL fold metallo-hydrolase [Candidatus Delongbacteria bacterium]
MDSLHIISDGNLEVNYGRQKLSPSSFSSSTKLGVSCLLIKKSNKYILIDTGPGIFNTDENKYLMEYPRQLLVKLNDLNIQPAEINTVILTHFHFDHCGGCINTAGEPIFNNAIHSIQKKEVEYSKDNPEFSKYALPFFNTLNEYGLLKVIDGDILIENSIELISSPGHTAGFQYVKFVINNQNYVFPGDIIPTLWHINNDNIIGIDLYPEALNNAKRKIIEDCINDDGIMIFQHSLRPTMGKLVKKEKRIGFKKYPN